jgi:hypothetical protein
MGKRFNALKKIPGMGLRIASKTLPVDGKPSP